MYGDDGQVWSSSVTSGGNDYLYGGNGADWVFGEGGSDYVSGDDGGDYVYGGYGMDTLHSGAFSNAQSYPYQQYEYLFGDFGIDTFYSDNSYVSQYDDAYTSSGSGSGGGCGATSSASGYVGSLSWSFSSGYLNVYGTSSADSISLATSGCSVTLGGTNIVSASYVQAIYVYGYDGNDSISAGSLSTGIATSLSYVNVYAGAGNDYVYGSSVSDTLSGDDGDDTLSGSGSADSLYGGDGNDTLYATDDGVSDNLMGGAGNDLLYGNGDYVSVSGSDADGDDTYRLLNMTAINDTSGTNTVSTNSMGWPTGFTYSLASGAFSVTGSTATTSLVFSTAVVSSTAYVRLNGLSLAPASSVTTLSITGSSAADTIDLRDIDDADIGLLSTTLSLLGGNDVAYGSFAEDELNGGDGNDSLWGEDRNDLLLGGAGVDSLNAGYGDDTLDGGDGNDELNGNGGDDELSGGEGNDVMYGGYGNDTCYGGDGADSLYPGEGTDWLFGGLGNDFLFLEDQTDYVFDESGTNVVYQDGGSTTFPVYTGGSGSGSGNHAPTAGADSFTTDEDIPLEITFSQILNNDIPGPSNESAQNIRIISAYGGTIGSVSVVDGKVHYRPNTNVSGTDTFTYIIIDNGQTNGSADPKTASGTVTVVITAVNDYPVVNLITNRSVTEGAGATISIIATDVESGTNLTYAATPLPDGLSLSGATITGTISYNAFESSTNGSLTTDVTVTDEGGRSSTVSFTWTITNVGIGTLTLTETYGGVSTGNSLTVTADDPSYDILYVGVSDSGTIPPRSFCKSR